MQVTWIGYIRLEQISTSHSITIGSRTYGQPSMGA